MERFSYRHRAKEDCAMYRNKGCGEYCAGLSELECCWGECKFYKSKETFDYERHLKGISEYSDKE